jgi:nascent polypeptide-associated complex subunit alpha
MMPNMDPRALKGLMAKMGIKSSELDASRVVIEMQDREIVITNPQITKIEAQGSISFQIAGDISESEKKVKMDITKEDVDLVKEQTGVADETKVREAIESSNGNIAEAILRLKGD